MHSEVRELSEFYDSALGQVARRTILRQVRVSWPELKGLRVLGYGFAVPYLRPFLTEADRTIAMMPAQQGALKWPGGRSLALLGEEDALPFADAFFDRILVVHGLETAEAVRPLMRQLWRVLAPSGRLMLVVPNRASLWAQVERSPFAQGRPYNRGQLDRLLRENMLVPEHWSSALLMPPLNSRRLIRTGAGWERIGRRLWGGLAGVHLVEASKSLYAMTPPVPVREKRLVFAGSHT